MPHKPLVIFVCTGNYYRSRFAEYLFVDLVEKQGLVWQADSAGLGVDWAQKINPGPVSKVTVASLKHRGIDVAKPKMPRMLTIEDLETAARVILLDEPEHRPMMQKQFPDWADHDRVSYWKVIDVPPSDDFHPMDAIEPLVHELIRDISNSTV